MDVKKVKIGLFAFLKWAYTHRQDIVKVVTMVSAVSEARKGAQAAQGKGSADGPK